MNITMFILQNYSETLSGKDRMWMHVIQIQSIPSGFSNSIILTTTVHIWKEDVYNENQYVSVNEFFRK